MALWRSVDGFMFSYADLIDITVHANSTAFLDSTLHVCWCYIAQLLTRSCPVQRTIAVEHSIFVPACIHHVADILLCSYWWPCMPAAAQVFSCAHMSCSGAPMLLTQWLCS
jgi:hypothetical protein